MDIARRVELLRTDDPEQVRVVVDDLRAHGGVEDWDDLVEGWSADFFALDPDDRFFSRRQRVSPLNAERVWHWADGTSRALTVAALLGAAPEGGAAAAFRDRITAANLSGAVQPSMFPEPDLARTRPVDLTPLAGLPNLERLKVRDTREVRGLEVLIAAGRLSSLELHRVGVAALDLAPLAHLESVLLHHVSGVPAIEGLPPALARLDLANTPLPRSVAGLPSLQVVHTDSRELDWLTPLTQLESLRCVRPVSTGPIAALTGLRQLSIEDYEAAVGLTPLELPALETLAISGIDGLAGLAGSVLPALRMLRITGTDKLTSLAGLEGLTEVRSAEISADRLTDLSAVAAWPKLTTLTLRSRRLVDLGPLARLARLTELHVRECGRLRDLGPLAELNLRELTLGRVLRGKATIPDALEPVVIPPPRRGEGEPSPPTDPPAPAARSSAPPSAPPLRARPQASAIKRLVLTRDLGQIRQGIELLRGLDDGDVAEALLSGTTLRSRTAAPWLRQLGLEVAGVLPETFDELVPNPLLAFGPPLMPFRAPLLRAIVGYAPRSTPTAEALRSRLRNLFCEAVGSGGRTHPVDLAPIAALPDLEALVLTRIAELVDRPALALAAKLRTLALVDLGEADLTGLASPTVTNLVVSGVRWPVSGFAGFPAARHLVWRAPDDLGLAHGDLAHGDLAHLPNLTSAWVVSGGDDAVVPLLARSPLHRLSITDLAGPAATLAPLAAQPTLTDLTIRYAELGDVAPMRALRSVRRLTLVAASAHNLGALAELPHLSELILDWATLTGDDLRALAGAPALRRLVLRDSVRFDDPIPTALLPILERDA